MLTITEDIQIRKSSMNSCATFVHLEHGRHACYTLNQKDRKHWNSWAQRFKLNGLAQKCLKRKKENHTFFSFFKYMMVIKYFGVNYIVNLLPRCNIQ